MHVIEFSLTTITMAIYKRLIPNGNLTISITGNVENSSFFVTCLSDFQLDFFLSTFVFSECFKFNISNYYQFGCGILRMMGPKK